MRRDLFIGVVLGAVASTAMLMAGTAVAGTGIGAVFNLGKTNTVNAQSTLKGATNARSLQITNTGSGAGLGITVGSGKPPIVVNPAAGRATNLNADELDGKNASAFVRWRTFSTTLAVQTSDPTLATLANGITVGGGCSNVTGANLTIKTTSGSATLQGSGSLSVGSTIVPFNMDGGADSFSISGNGSNVDIDVIARDSSVGDFARIDIHGSGSPGSPCPFWGLMTLAA